MKRKSIIFSFDYELFFGNNSGTVKKSLIDPTNKILDTMDALGVKGNFFVDWMMLKYLKKENTERTLSDLNLIINQLKDIVQRGHRIELHIHPHWVDAKYNGNGTWNFSEFRHYSLNSFSEEAITKMFIDGVSLLTGIARIVDSNYEIVAFRAGGWAVQPFNGLIEGFLKSGIRIDSSVMFGAHQINEYSSFDFRLSPNVDLYRFSKDVCINHESGEFIEVPISTFKMNIFNLFFQGISNRLHMMDRITDGTHDRSNNLIIKEHLKHKQRFRLTYQSFTFSQLSPINVLYANLKNDKKLLCYIDHPKDFSSFTLLNIKLACKFGSTITYKDLLINN